MPILLRCDRCNQTAPPKTPMIHHLQLPDGWHAQTSHATSPPHDILACSDDCRDALTNADPQDDLGPIVPQG